jgi:hypothetical protein
MAAALGTPISVMRFVEPSPCVRSAATIHSAAADFQYHHRFLVTVRPTRARRWSVLCATSRLLSDAPRPLFLLALASWRDATLARGSRTECRVWRTGARGMLPGFKLKAFDATATTT